MPKRKIYFDNAASTKVDQRVVLAMRPFYLNNYGNASSLHCFGSQVKDALESSRSTIASFAGADAEELVFTSGGTEANNFALKGIAFANIDKGRHIIVSGIEHDSITSTCKWLNKIGFEITYLPVDSDGLVNVHKLEESIRSDTVLVSVMHANNEIGTVQPIEKIGDICKNRGVYFHTDACQSFGKIKIDMHKQNIDLLSINAHKIYGPKGVGGLIVRKNVKIDPLLHGGGQERGLRSSTENIPCIVGFAKAVYLCNEEMVSEMQRLTILRDKIIDYILNVLSGAYLNGHRLQRLANNINISLNGYEGEAIRLLMLLDNAGISVSSGSACSSNKGESNPSHVLMQIGRNPFQARGALRITLGRYNTEKEVEYFLQVLTKSIYKLKPIFS